MTAPSRDALILSHLHLVAPIARRLLKSLPDQVERDDVEGYLRLGLVEAATRWDTETAAQHGASFITYARWRMVGTVLDWLRREDMLPRRERQRVRAGLADHFVEQWSPIRHDDADDTSGAAYVLGRVSSAEVKDQVEHIRRAAEDALDAPAYVIWHERRYRSVHASTIARRYRIPRADVQVLLAHADATLDARGILPSPPPFALSVPAFMEAAKWLRTNT